jgi:death on curing protein
MARKTIKRINLAEVEYISFQLAKKFMEYNEPIPDFETRFLGILESCIRTPFQTFDKKSLYKGLIEKSAILFYLMVKNHPFQNGNKRVAITTLIFFLVQNGKWLSVSNHNIYKFACDIAGSKPEEKDNKMISIRSFIEDNIEKFDPTK